jgi:two-component system, sensor histidine kinase and response regulator
MNGPELTRLLEEIDALPPTAARDSIRLQVERLHAENGRLAGDLSRTVRMNDVFVGTLSHDLRNPLGAILMSATVLSRKVEDDGLKRSLGRIITAGKRMNQMIAELLDFTRTRRGDGLALERARIDLLPIFRQAIDGLPGAAGGPPVTFEHQGDTRGWWDAERLAQAATSLVGNAVRHGAAEGAVRVRIDGREGGRVKIDVSNAGTIPIDLLPELFEPFKGDDPRNRRRGLGLGLFITREIVTAHRGTLEVASSGDVTTFEMSLPRGEPAAT